MAALGTQRDRASHTRYDFNNVDPASTYEGSGLARKIVDAIPEGVTREWRAWHGAAGQIGALEATESRLKVAQTVELAMHYARLWGGGAILIGADTSDPSRPLEPSRIKRDGVEYLTAFTRYDLAAGPQNRDPRSGQYGEPTHYTLNMDLGQEKIHPSRLVLFKGPRRAIRNRLGQLDPWGVSILDVIWSEVSGCDQGMQNALSLLFEANVDVFGIPDYSAGYDTEGDAYLNRVQARVGLAAMQKSNLRALVMDAAEKYERRSITFTGITDILDRAQQFLAGVSGIPVSELFGGRQKTGLGGDAGEEKRSWYDLIRSKQKNEVSPATALLDECLIRSALGSRPAEVYYSWSPLWQMTHMERAELASKTATTVKTLSDARVFTPDALHEAAVTALTETGAMPGLETAADDGAPEDQDETKRTGDAPDDDTPTNARRRVEMADARMKPLYLARPVVNAEQILAHYRAQGIQGLEDAAELHVTIAYSRGAVDWHKASDEWAGSELEIMPDALRRHEKFGPDQDTLVLAFKSEALRWRNEALREAGATWDFPEYVPHITLLKPFTGDEESITAYTGPIVLGPEKAEQPKPTY